MTIRRAGRDDVPAVLGLLDGATEWLVARGRTDQWGTEPHSTNPRRIAQITGFADDGGLWVAGADDRVVGALAVGAALPYVPAPNGRVTFEVRDEGPGFDPSTDRSGTGLTGMADHVEALGGRFAVDSAPGRGTTVRGSVPTASPA